MKRSIYILFLIALFALSSCKKEELILPAGNTINTSQQVGKNCSDDDNVTVGKDSGDRNGSDKGSSNGYVNVGKDSGDRNGSDKGNRRLVNVGKDIGDRNGSDKGGVSSSGSSNDGDSQNNETVVVPVTAD